VKGPYWELTDRFIRSCERLYREGTVLRLKLTRMYAQHRLAVNNLAGTG